MESSAFGSPTVFHKQSHPPAEIRSEFRLWKSSSFGAPTEFCLWSPPQLVNEIALRKRIVTFLCFDGVPLKEPSASGTLIKAPLEDNSTLGSSIGVPLVEPSLSGTLNGVPPEDSSIFVLDGVPLMKPSASGEKAGFRALLGNNTCTISIYRLLVC